MNTRTIVTVMAAVLLSVSFAPVSAAQDKIGSTQEEIEVITIIGKRPAPIVAVTCEDATLRAEVPAAPRLSFYATPQSKSGRDHKSSP
jgi:hypothetical protein